MGGSAPARSLSYQLCHLRGIAQREKRSISLPPDLAADIEAAAAAECTTVSAWIAATARHRGDAVDTADPAHLQAIADAVNACLRLATV